MRKSILIAAFAAAAFAGATPVFAAEPPAICIRHDDINNWSSIDDKHVVLTNYRHQKALLTMIGTCSNFKFSDAIEIRSPGASGLDCIAVGDEVQTRGIGSGPIHGRCAVVKIEPYTGQSVKPADHHDGDSH